MVSVFLDLEEEGGRGAGRGVAEDEIGAVAGEVGGGQFQPSGTVLQVGATVDAGT